jgi:hypothetical protein
MKLTKKILIGMGLVTAVVAFTLLSGGEVLAASSKDVIIANTPADPVPITGTVEVVNDALYEPYIRTTFIEIADGVRFGEVTFDVPDGKRLILETVAVQALVPEGQKVRVSLQAQVNPFTNKYVQAWLPVQSPGPILGVEYYIANHPVKLRQDPFFGTDEISVIMLRDLSGGTASLSVTVFGYLVNL